MVKEESLVSIVSKNEILKMTGLTISQNIANCVIKSEVIQVFEQIPLQTDFIYVFYKENPNRKGLRIQIGDQIYKSRVQERPLPIKENSKSFNEDIFKKFQNHQMVELNLASNNLKKQQNSNIIKIYYCEISRVQPMLNCLYSSSVKRFSQSITTHIKSYDLRIFLKTTSQIDFLKVECEAKTQILLHHSKRSVSIALSNLKNMEDLLLYFRHKNINIPQVSCGREKGGQTMLMVDYLPPFNIPENFRDCLKKGNHHNLVSSPNAISEKNDNFQFESVEFCIVMDTSSTLGQFDCNQMKFLMNSILKKLEKYIVKESSKNEIRVDNLQEVQNNVNYVNFSIFDVTGWQQQYLKLRENTLNEHSIIQNQIFPKIVWKSKPSNLIQFLNDFESSTNGVPRILFIITQGIWEDMKLSLKRLDEMRRKIEEHRLYKIGNKQWMADNFKENSSKESNSKQNDCNYPILDLFMFYQGNDLPTQSQLESVVYKERLFTWRTINDPEFPVNDLLYLKKQDNFSINANQEEIQFSSLPINLNSLQLDNSTLTLNANQLFQQFILLKKDIKTFKGYLRFYDWRTREHYKVKIEIPEQSNLKQPLNQIKEQKKILYWNEIAEAGLTQFLQKISITLQSIDLIQSTAIQNNIVTQLTQEVFQSFSGKRDVQVIENKPQDQSKSPQQQSNSANQNQSFLVPMKAVYNEKKIQVNALNLVNKDNFILVDDEPQKEDKDTNILKVFPKKKEEKESKLLDKQEKKQLQQIIINNPPNSQLSPIQTTPVKNKSQQLIQAILESQNSQGNWDFSRSLLQMLGYSKEDFIDLKNKFFEVPRNLITTLLMTCIILVELKMRFQGFYSEWEKSQNVSTKWIDQNFNSSVYVKVIEYAKKQYDKKHYEIHIQREVSENMQSK